MAQNQEQLPKDRKNLEDSASSYIESVTAEETNPERRFYLEIMATERLEEVAATIGATSEQVVSLDILRDIQSLTARTTESAEWKATIADAARRCHDDKERWVLARLLLGRAIGLTEDEIAEALANERKISPKAAKTLLTKVSQYLQEDSDE